MSKSLVERAREKAHALTWTCRHDLVGLSGHEPECDERTAAILSFGAEVLEAAAALVEKERRQAAEFGAHYAAAAHDDSLREIETLKSTLETKPTPSGDGR